MRRLSRLTRGRAAAPRPAALLCAFLCAALSGCDAEPALHNATRFVARMSCSCVFVSGRELQGCLDDLPGETASWFSVRVDGQARRVTASALWVDGVAGFEEGKGCMLLD